MRLELNLCREYRVVVLNPWDKWIRLLLLDIITLLDNLIWQPCSHLKDLSFDLQFKLLLEVGSGPMIENQPPLKVASYCQSFAVSFDKGNIPY